MTEWPFFFFLTMFTLLGQPGTGQTMSGHMKNGKEAGNWLEFHQRNKTETAEKFVKRITQFPDNKPYSIIETQEWDSAKTIILAFIPTPDEITVGLMFVPADSFTYQQVLIDSFSTLGNTANIEDVFFFNTDSDKTKELIVMATYDQRQKDNSIKKIYWNLIFDDPNLSALRKKLKYLRETSKKIDGYKFKNQSAIITGLSQFDKDQPFEIINSKKGITEQSSDKDTNKCKNWTIPQAIIPLIIKDSKVISGEQWHDDFGVFRCIISGHLSQNGQTYKFEINGGSWIYIYCNGETIILGSYKKEYEKYFISNAWNGK